VVANCAMNRERRLLGSNGYARELGVDPLSILRARFARAFRRVSWLDLCCGSGRALIEALDVLGREGLAERVDIVGVDLVDHFSEPSPPNLSLVAASVASWAPERPFDLVTCVHGLHYVGDKLGTISRAASWLRDDGLFVATFDAGSIRLADGDAAGRQFLNALRAAGLTYDARRRRVMCDGHRTAWLPSATSEPTTAPGPITQVSRRCTPTTVRRHNDRRFLGRGRARPGSEPASSWTSCATCLTSAWPSRWSGAPPSGARARRVGLDADTESGRLPQP
jgi:SAM-dependent methyltransferase